MIKICELKRTDILKFIIQSPEKQTKVKTMKLNLHQAESNMPTGDRIFKRKTRTIFKNFAVMAPFPSKNLHK